MSEGFTPLSPSALYGRKFSLAVAGKDNDGLDLSELQCQFTVRAWEKETPTAADIRIFNVKKETAVKMAKEFTRVVLKAGYESQFGVIFDGTIIQYRRGRLSPVDTYVDITAQAGDGVHVFGTVSTTLAAGSTPDDRYKALLQSIQSDDVQQGYTSPLQGPTLPRGRVLYGMTRDCLRDLGDQTQTNWTIHNGKLEMVARDGYLPDQAVVLTADTGMIGMPVQTVDGIMVRCLLNPLLRPNGRVQLNNASIQQARLSPDYKGIAPFDANTARIAGTGDQPQHEFSPASPAADQDGIYGILAVDHVGDTRGNTWYSELACVVPAQQGTPSQTQRTRGLGA
jgi:hypothetical protein